MNTVCLLLLWISVDGTLSSADSMVGCYIMEAFLSMFKKIKRKKNSWREKARLGVWEWHAACKLSDSMDLAWYRMIKNLCT